MRLECGCEALWLTEASVPKPVGKVLAEPCVCCGAPRGKRCKGGAAGYVTPPKKFVGAFGPDRMGYADVCPDRALGPAQGAML